MISISADQRAFAEKLFEIYPKFLPTRSLFLDLEGSGNGNERVVSLFWPQNPARTRLGWVVAAPGERIVGTDIQSVIDELDTDLENPNSVVVYSAGRENPDERTRVLDLLGFDPWPQSTWINLLYVTQLCREMSTAIRDHRNVVFRNDRTQVRRSLEALEWEFGIVRTADIRGHSNVYRDGLAGEMHALQSASDYAAGFLEPEDARSFEAYCRKDVESMFKISRTCDRGIFSSSIRARRIAQHG